MLKKAVIVQIVVLLIEVVVGSLLLNQFDQGIKMVHGVIGIAVVLASSTVVYLTLRARISALVTSLALVSGALTVLAYVGGKMTTVNYEQGMLMMRASAIAALLVSVICFFALQKAAKSKVVTK